jgi:hypothetical protein
MPHPIGRAILIASIVVACSAQADIYQSRDAAGRPVFSDRPVPGAKPVQLPPVNTTPALEPATRSEAEPNGFSGYSRIGLDITKPVPNGLAPVTVGIVIEPALRAGDSWVLSLDGRRVAEDDSATSYTFQQLSRGQHQLSLQVMRAGKVVGSATEQVFVFWPGKHNSSPAPKPKP